VLYAAPPKNAPTNVPHAREIQQFDCNLPLVCSFLTCSTVILSAHTSATHTLAEINVSAMVNSCLDAMKCSMYTYMNAAHSPPHAMYGRRRPQSNISYLSLRKPNNGFMVHGDEIIPIAIVISTGEKCNTSIIINCVATPGNDRQ
jgi:hypothetical protein